MLNWNAKKMTRLVHLVKSFLEIKVKCFNAKPIYEKAYDASLCVICISHLLNIMLVKSSNVLHISPIDIQFYIQ